MRNSNLCIESRFPEPRKVGTSCAESRLLPASIDVGGANMSVGVAGVALSDYAGQRIINIALFIFLNSENSRAGKAGPVKQLDLL